MERHLAALIYPYYGTSGKAGEETRNTHTKHWQPLISIASS